MPKRKKASKKPKLILKTPSKKELEEQDLDAYIKEADEVRAMLLTPGWAILERDLSKLYENLIPVLAYKDPKRSEFYEAQVLYIAIDKILALVKDYETNRDKAIEFLNKIQNPELAVTMDVDNE